ncbi:MAG: O-antigen ligase family protein [Beijerinckiaceae bacterium]
MATTEGRLDALATPAAEAQLRQAFRATLFVLIALSVWISTRPFQVVSPEEPATGGDIVNQLAYSGLAALSFVALCMLDRRALLPLLQPSWLLLFSWMLFCVIGSTEPAISQRAFAFSTIIMFLAASLFVLPRDIGQFRILLFGVALATLVLAWAGVILLPDIGKHTDFDPFEPEHSGSWKGHFDHKNGAGAMMGILALTGIYALREGKRWVGLALLLGGVVFLYFTNSKTSLGLLPMAFLLALVAEKMRFLPVRLLVCLAPILALLTLTLGGALFEDIATLNKAILKDPSFTGRFDIWRYGFEKLAERPWTGFGLEAFWQTPTTILGESKLELAWSVEKIVHGHSSYLDVALTLGLPGLALVVYVFLLKPVFDFHHAAAQDGNRLLATFCLSVWLFVALGMCLETYFFRRADPVWFSFLIAVFGLRFSATFRASASPAQAGS